MDLNSLQSKLIRIARANPPSDHVPYCFEKRVMALLRTAPRLDAWAFWARALWGAATPCLALILLLATWMLLNPAGTPLNNGSTNPAVDAAQQFENTVLAASDSEPAAAFLQ